MPSYYNLLTFRSKSILLWNIYMIVFSLRQHNSGRYFFLKVVLIANGIYITQFTVSLLTRYVNLSSTFNRLFMIYIVLYIL